MQRVWLYRILIVIGLLPPLAVACGDAARGAFDEAAALDRGQQQLEAATKYMKVHSDSSSSRYGKLARARAEVLLLELGAQHLQQKNWSDLDQAAGKLIELDSSSVAGHLYRAYALYGQGEFAKASKSLKQAAGTPRGVTPPSKEAVEATAVALFDGTEAGAQSALDGSLVDGQFLKNARARLGNKINREQSATKRRAALLAEGTLDSMATLLDNYSKSPEATKVRRPYAEKLAAKLQSIATVGPPTVEDPDPIATLADSLIRRAPEEGVTKAALAKVKVLRAQWEANYEEQLTTIDDQVAIHHAKRMDQIALVITNKCAPARGRLEKAEAGAAETLALAREEAVKLVPNGLTPEDLQEVARYILANCTPQKQN